MNFLQKIFAGTKATAVATACLLVAGCVFGDPTYSSYINVAFPGKSLEDVKPAVLDVGRKRGYRKGGFMLIDGKQDFEYCAPTLHEKSCQSDFRKCRINNNECNDAFRGKAKWQEAETIKPGSISFWFDVIKDGWIETGPEVMIQRVDGGCTVTFKLWAPSIELTKTEKDEYYALKALLIEQYGSLVTTKNEP